MVDIPDNFDPIQQESVASRAGVSEFVTQQMGGAVNYLLRNKATVGDMVMSVLSEAQFQAERDTTWVLCDGRGVAGSDYEALTGSSFIPDARGRFPRGKDHGTGRDANGDLPTGSAYDDKLQDHYHTGNFGPYYYGNWPSSPPGFAAAGDWPGHTTGSWNTSGVTSAPVSSETFPKTVIVNMFIKINV